MTGNISRLAGIVVLGFVLLQSATTDALANGGYSSFFQVDGDVQKPGKYDLNDLKTLPETNQNVVFISGQGSTSRKFTGVLLWDFLQRIGIETDPNAKNGILRKIIGVGATDGYVVYLSAGELDPRFGGHQVMLVYAEDEKLLGPDSGFARLVFPGDKAGGRAVSWISWIHVW